MGNVARHLDFTWIFSLRLAEPHAVDCLFGRHTQTTIGYTWRRVCVWVQWLGRDKHSNVSTQRRMCATRKSAANGVLIEHRQSQHSNILGQRAQSNWSVESKECETVIGHFPLNKIPIECHGMNYRSQRLACWKHALSIPHEAWPGKRYQKPKSAFLTLSPDSCTSFDMVFHVHACAISKY